MSQSKKPKYPVRPYYATREFVRRGYARKRKWRMIFAALVALPYLAAELFVNQAPLSLVRAIGIPLVSVALFSFVLIVTRFTDLIDQTLSSREHIERCTEYVSQYDETALETIERMAQNDGSATQISTSLLSITLGIGLGFILGSNPLPTEFAIIIGAFVAVVVPLFILENSKQDSVNVVIRQAVVLQLDTLKHECVAPTASNPTPST